MRVRGAYNNLAHPIGALTRRQLTRRRASCRMCSVGFGHFGYGLVGHTVPELCPGSVGRPTQGVPRGVRERDGRAGGRMYVCGASFIPR